MRYKKLLFLALLCFVIYSIYTLFHTEKINYLSIGDSLSLGVNAYGEISYGYSDYLANYLEREQKLKTYYKDFSVPGYRISDLEHQLDTNQYLSIGNNSLSFKKCLREADLVTLSIGGNDLLSEISLSTVDIETLQEEEILEIIDKVNNDLDSLLKELRKYAKRRIVFIGYYYPYKQSSFSVERVFSYLNDKFLKTCQKYDITYINTYYTFKNNPDYLPNPTNIHPGSSGYEAISDLIIKQLDI